MAWLGASRFNAFLFPSSPLVGANESVFLLHDSLRGELN